MRSRPWHGPAVVFAVALLVRAIHLVQMSRTPFFDVLMGDARAYDAWAREIAAGQWIGTDVFYQAPLYPYFLGLLYTIAGRSLMAVRVVQAVLGSTSCVLVGLAAGRLFSRPAGLAAGLAMAMYAPAIFFDGIIQKSVLDVWLVSLAIWIVSGIVSDAARASSHLRRTPRRAWSPGTWFGLGLVLGALGLTRENALVFVPVVLIWIARSREHPPREQVRTAGVFLAGVALAIVPVAARNAALGGGFAVTAQFGPNFYIGNNPQADGTYMALRAGRGAPEYERQDATDLAQQATGRTLTPAEVSRYWTQQAWAYIAAHPGAWLGLLGRKLLLIVNATEMLDTESQASYAEWSAPLRLTGWISHFGVLVPLAVFGLLVSWSARARLGVLCGMLGAYAGSIVFFYVFARYRFPLVPFLMVCAAGGLAGARRFFREQPIPRRVGALVAVAASALVSNRPLLATDLMRAITETNLGAALHERSRFSEAAARYRRALAIRSDYAPAYNNLGAALRALGRLDEAIASYGQALRLRPDYGSARRNLANALGERGNTRVSRGLVDEGIADLRRATDIRPDDAAARYDLATALLEAGRPGDAVDHLRETLKLMPGSADVHNNLGIALASIGRIDEAIVHFEQALRLRPDSAEARRNLEQAKKSARPAAENLRPRAADRPGRQPARARPGGPPRPS